jgi:bifunctional DNA-binding transcriptional regulator/antitoxin component of YhaV-PrlF toxin-antitoxin module
MGLFRRGGPPGEVRERLGLGPGERVLAYARTSAGSYVVATDRALYIERDRDFLRLGWEAVDYAGWDDEASTLNVVETGPGRGVHALMLADPGYLPETVRERVMSSIVVSQHVRLAGTRGVRIVGRRGADGGGLHWTLTFDPGLDPEDPGLRAAAERALTDLRVQTGV